MGEGYGRKYFHFTPGETSVGGKELLTWPKIPHSSQSWRTTWASGKCFVHYFESIFLTKQLLMWGVCPHYPVWLSDPLHPSMLCLFFLAKFRVSCFPWNLPGLLQALAVPPSFLYTLAFRMSTIHMLISHALSPQRPYCLVFLFGFWNVT